MLNSLYVLVDQYEENEGICRHEMVIDMVWPQVLIVMMELAGGRA